MNCKIAILGFLLALPAWAQQTNIEQEGKLLALEKMWNQAQITRDSNALQTLIADKFIDTEYDGDVSDRKKFLADIRDPEYKPSAMNVRT